jgi:hypothetical protein
MKQPILLCLASMIALTGGCKAEGVRGNLADMLIIDRDNGAVLTPYLYHGEYWIAGRPGSRYAVEVRNHLGERLLAVMSVDGINVVSGATAAWGQPGYVFSPGGQYQVTGWRKSDSEIAAFTFTESPNSYAERTGRPANVGVIGVALFRERAPIAIPAKVAPADSARAQSYNSNRLSAGRPFGAESMPPAVPAAAPRAQAAAQAQTAAPAQAAAPALAAAPLPPTAPVFALPKASSLAAPPSQAPAPEPKLGTGHGDREYSYVTDTEFVRMQSSPNEVLRIHYDSRANLIAMGIIPRDRPPAPYSNPFPGSAPSYVPDPPG